LEEGNGRLRNGGPTTSTGDRSGNFARGHSHLERPNRG